MPKTNRYKKPRPVDDHEGIETTMKYVHDRKRAAIAMMEAMDAE